MLPDPLKKDLDNFCRSLFVGDPYGCFGLDSHSLKGRLKSYRALEIDWNQTSYRLVYRVYEKPAPKRVLILSFAEHDEAYRRATERKGISPSY